MKIVVSVKSLRSLSENLARLDYVLGHDMAVNFWRDGDKVYAGSIGLTERFICELPEAVVSDSWTDFAIDRSNLKAISCKLKGGSVEFELEPLNKIRVRYVEELWDMEMVVRTSENGIGKVPIPKIEWKKNENVISLYRKAVKCASRDHTRAVLNGVHYEKGAVVSTDGRRLLVYAGYENPIEPFTLPINKLLMSGALNEPTDIAMDNKVIWFKFDGAFYGVEGVEGTFPNWRQVVPAKNGLDNVVHLEDEAIHAIDIFAGMMNSQERCVKLVGNGRSVNVTANNASKERGMKASLRGKAIMDSRGTMCLDIFYFLESLKMGFRDFKFCDSLSPIVSELSGWTFVIMPMRESA